MKINIVFKKTVFPARNKNIGDLNNLCPLSGAFKQGIFFVGENTNKGGDVR
jgi:hypothetical protein